MAIVRVEQVGAPLERVPGQAPTQGCDPRGKAERALSELLAQEDADVAGIQPRPVHLDPGDLGACVRRVFLDDPAAVVEQLQHFAARPDRIAGQQLQYHVQLVRGTAGVPVAPQPSHQACQLPVEGKADQAVVEQCRRLPAIVMGGAQHIAIDTGDVQQALGRLFVEAGSIGTETLEQAFVVRPSSPGACRVRGARRRRHCCEIPRHRD